MVMVAFALVLVVVLLGWIMTLAGPGSLVG